MGRFDVKNVDKTPSDAEEKEKYLVAGIQFGGEILLVRAKHSTRYR